MNITKYEFEELPLHVSDSVDECIICQENMIEYIKLKCKHKFHKKCIYKWFFESNREKTDCPICRTEINSEEKELLNLYFLLKIMTYTGNYRN